MLSIADIIFFAKYNTKYSVAITLTSLFLRRCDINFIMTYATIGYLLLYRVNDLLRYNGKVMHDDDNHPATEADARERRSYPVPTPLRRLARAATNYYAAHKLAVRVGAGIALFAVIALLLWPRSLVFAYDRPSCVSNPVLLPGLHSYQSSDTYELVATGVTSIAGYPVFASRACATPQQAPRAHVTEAVAFKPFSNPLITKKISVTAGLPPEVTTDLAEIERISVQDPLELTLETADGIYDYRIRISKRVVDCLKVEARLSCDVPALKLKQGEKYRLELVRLFSGEPTGSVFTQNIRTVTPIKITKSSIKPGATVHDKPKRLILTANKPIAEVANIELVRTDKKAVIEHVVSVSGKRLTITFKKALPRRAEFALSITELDATDNGFLAAPYELAFKAGGGPKVTGIDIAGYAVSAAVNPTLTLDYEPTSDAKKLRKSVTIRAGSKTVESTVTTSGRSVTIAPRTSLGRCTPFTIRVNDKLPNKHGVTGGTEWSFSSRTLCQAVSTIGNSVQGRAITSYSFGSGSTVLYVGATHGSEPGSMYTLRSWVDELERNPGKIPSNRRIVVIPNVNPDGIAANSRTNANGKDLNRNFPANNWKADVTLPGGRLVKNGGGKTPLSEPESKVLANYTTSLGPELVLTYHSKGSLVISNDTGSSRAWADTYGSLSGYRSLYHSQSAGTFEYDTTGAYEDWLRDKLGIPALLIEQHGHYGSEFSSNQTAMWEMVRLP